MVMKLVSERVFRLLSFKLLSLLLGATMANSSDTLSTFSEASGVISAIGEPIRLTIGDEPKQLPTGQSIKLVKIIEDTRCPFDKLCVSTGLVKFEIEVKAKETRTHTLSLYGLARKVQVDKVNTVILDSMDNKAEPANNLSLFFFSLDPYPGFGPLDAQRYPTNVTASFYVLK